MGSIASCGSTSFPWLIFVVVVVFVSKTAVRVHDSQAYRKMDVTNDLLLKKQKTKKQQILGINATGPFYSVKFATSFKAVKTRRSFVAANIPTVFAAAKIKLPLQSDRLFSSFQSIDRSGRRGDMRDDSAEILFQSFLREALVSSSGMGRSVHSLMLSIQHFLCRPRRRPPSKIP